MEEVEARWQRTKRHLRRLSQKGLPQQRARACALALGLEQVPLAWHRCPQGSQVTGEMDEPYDGAVVGATCAHFPSLVLEMPTTTTRAPKLKRSEQKLHL